MTRRLYSILFVQALVLIGCGKADFENREVGQQQDTGVVQSGDKSKDASPQVIPGDDQRMPKVKRPRTDAELNGSGVAKSTGEGGNMSVAPHYVPKSPVSSLPKSASPDHLTAQPRLMRTEPDAPMVARSVAAPEVTAPVEAERETKESIRFWKEGEQYKTVTVFYGTDRARTHDDFVGLGWQISHYAIPGLAIVLGLIATVVLCVRSQKRIAAVAAVLAIGGAALFVKFVPLNMPMRLLVADKGIPKYGGERGELTMGTCKVTIPRTHTTGNVERPDIRRFEVNESVRQHVVLANVQPMADEVFYEQLQQSVARSPRRDLFLFIHGYNVTFQDAALRTGQMAFDLEFEGAPVFYSWPSQGVYWKYTVDENNVTWAVPDLKRFLLDIAKHSGAKSINLIAHSMGNRALTQALRDISQELKDDPMLFNQLILAAPDIDADTFKRDIAPVIQKTARRTTLYASSKDNALIASKKVHGYPRAGESGEHLLIVPGIYTIDVSNIETDMLGHSYYASSDLVLTDLKELFMDVGPTLRRWLQEVKSNGLTYWVYQKTRASFVSKKTDAVDR